MSDNGTVEHHGLERVGGGCIGGLGLWSGRRGRHALGCLHLSGGAVCAGCEPSLGDGGIHHARDEDDAYDRGCGFKPVMGGPRGRGVRGLEMVPCLLYIHVLPMGLGTGHTGQDVGVKE